MDVPGLLSKYDLKPVGIIQVGSHHGEEIPLWRSLGVPSVHFEPVRSNYQKMMNDFPEETIYPVAPGQVNRVMDMYCETVNGGQSCSLLQPKKHLEILPWIKFDRREKVLVARLDDFQIQNCNGLFIDAQGYELEVLGGGPQTITRFIDFIFVEVNRAEVFEECPKIEEMDFYLGTCGFHRVETDWHGGDFGDALFIRK